MEYSTESLLFLSDYANSRAIPKNLALSAEAKEFCHQSDQFVNEAKLDPENDDIEAQTGVMNFMILASNIQRYREAHQTGEMDLSIVEYKSSDAESLLENRYHFSKKESAIRLITNVTRSNKIKWIYRIILIALILTLLGFIISFVIGSYRVFPEENKDILGMVSDFFSYEVFGNQRPISKQEIWKETQEVRASRIWMLLALSIMTILVGFLYRFFRGYVTKQSGICARYHLFVKYMRELEGELYKKMEEL